MIVRIEIDRTGDVYEYRVLEDGALLFDDRGFSAVAVRERRKGLPVTSSPDIVIP